jgi:hypothetical protein
MIKIASTLDFKNQTRANHSRTRQPGYLTTEITLK